LTGAANLAASGCNMRGSRTTSLLLGGHGIEASGSSRVHLSNCTVTGGDSVSHFGVFLGSGVRMTGNGAAWLVDSTISAAPWTIGTPGFAIHNGATLPVIIERCTLSNGGATFAPTNQGLVQNRLLLGVSMPNSPVSPGGLVQVDFRTQPGLFVAYHVAFRSSTPNVHPLLAETEWGFLANSLFLGYLVADAQGFASSVLPVPNIPGLVHLPLWFSGWTAVDIPVAVSPPVGVVLR